MKFLQKLIGDLGRRNVPPEEARTLGRNEPCWCGSGKKYKRCHEEQDERHFSREMAATCTTGG